jgi:hypothetical protein
VEKLTLGDSLFNRLFIRYYYQYKKRQGYSESEIAHKREALENVLIPYRPEENQDLVTSAGFRHNDGRVASCDIPCNRVAFSCHKSINTSQSEEKSCYID